MRNTLFCQLKRDGWCVNLSVLVIGRLAAMSAGNKPGRAWISKAGWGLGGMKEGS